MIKEKELEIENIDILMKMVGKFDENIAIIEKELGVRISIIDNMVKIMGPENEINSAYDVLKKCIDFLFNGEDIDSNKIRYLVSMIKSGKGNEIEKLFDGIVAITARGKQVKCKTIGQKRYIEALKNNTVVFGVGPAGTGKTYLAVAYAVKCFKNKEVDKIILTRPAVEAGEKLGFLPGDLQNKVDPYLRPLYDALQEMLGLECYTKMLERGEIEIAPLAYMRGRTLSNSFIILDEAQNTTSEQMKMFLTRMGEGSKMVVTGDVTQIDLPALKKSGLKQAMEILKNEKDISVIKLTDKDVVRHNIVQTIINAYDKYFKNKKTLEEKDYEEK